MNFIKDRANVSKTCTSGDRLKAGRVLCPWRNIPPKGAVSEGINSPHVSEVKCVQRKLNIAGTAIKLHLLLF